MSSFSNDGLYGEVSNKRRLENGNVPTYKPRKVSAIRDFPPGCGCNTLPTNLKCEEHNATETGILEAVGVNSYGTANVAVANGSITANLTEAESLNNFEMANWMETDMTNIADKPKLMKLGVIKNSEIVNAEGSGIKNPNLGVESWSHEAIKNSPIGSEAAESLDALVEKVTTMAMDGFSNEELIKEIKPLQVELPNEVDCQTLEGVDIPIKYNIAESLDELVGELMMTADVLSNGIEEVFTNTDSFKTELGGQTMLKELNVVEALVLAPKPGVEDAKPVSDASASVDEGQTMLKELNVVEALVLAPKPGVEDAKPVSDASASVDEVRLWVSSQTSSLFNGSVKLGTSSRPKEKFCPRRVSAVRDFPPHCGINNPLPTEENQQIVTSGNACLDGVETFEVESEANMPMNGSDKGALGEMLITSQNEKHPGGFDKVDVKTETTHRQVVLGLIAAPYCPWRKGKVASNNSSDGTSAGKARKHNLSKQQNSKAVALNNNVQADCLERSSMNKTAVHFSYDTEENSGSLIIIDRKDDEDGCLPEITPVPMSQTLLETHDDTGGPLGNEIVVYSPDRSDKMSHLHSVGNLVDEMEREVVHGLVAAPYSPWRDGKEIFKNSDVGISGGKMRKQKLSGKQKIKAIAKKTSPKMNFRRRTMKQKEVPVVNDADVSPAALTLTEEEGYDRDGDSPANSPAIHKTQDFDVSLPPFGFNYSGQGDARNKVRETLRLFHTICRKLLQKEEATSTPDEEGNLTQSGKKSKRIDLLSAKIIKAKGKEVNTDKQIFGHVPGVEVGDEFQYRVELAVVGIHRLYQAGIDWMKLNGVPVTTSIVASGAYSDDLENADVLIYSGQGGNIVGKAKKPEDQKLERGNLALRNSILAETPVRVVRGWKETKAIDPVDSKPKTVTIYVYDGLYTVKKYWTETGPHGKLVFMFELWRNPGQPELAWKELKSSNKFNTRPGVCVGDISGGKEPFPICAVNTLSDEKPPAFNYISKMMYPDWYHPIPPEGCNCTGRCTDSKKCQCAVRNGGEIPYNRNGAIVEVKPLVYECGPSCKCPPSCYNRVSQRGIKFKLEIFKTESRGWGIRSLNSVPSGSFICEYAGELLEDKEAEQRIGNDEYLFDIGQSCNDISLKPEEHAISIESGENVGYTIDAAQYGNVGRFVNHSCSPNLYAQNVIYDHDDKRMPHVMLFAAENIPPLQELTYHYNYTVDQIHDSNGNIKVKRCYCGSAECTGRMY